MYFEVKYSVGIFSLAQPTLHKQNKPTSLPSVAIDLAITALKRFRAYTYGDMFSRKRS
jgi:hypothetical protein